MNFVPEPPRVATQVPYFEDASREDGWQGQASTKTIEKLKAEITACIDRLGGKVLTIQSGKYKTGKLTRFGFRIEYLIVNGEAIGRGRIDIAALPLRQWTNIKQERTRRMALYMMRVALEGTWFLSQLSPGYAPLMPFMLTNKGKTITELWSGGEVMKNLLPEGSSDFIEEGDFREV